MFTHRWFFQGKLIKIIDGQTIVILVDLGFDIWHKILVRFNRIKTKGFCSPSIYPEKNPGTDATINFLEQNLKGKDIYSQIFKKKDYNGYNRYFAEVYVQPGDIPLRLKDVNKSFNDPHRIDGWVNLNDVMVGQGLATYLQFVKDENRNANIPLHNGSPRQHSEVRGSIENGLGTGDQTNSSGSGSPPQG